MVYNNGPFTFSDGIENMSRKLSKREVVSEKVYLYLIIFSRYTFGVGGIIGYASYRLTGCIVGALVGIILGIWMRRSLGLRGNDPYRGWFKRISERANGRKRGVLECCIETIRGDEIQL